MKRLLSIVLVLILCASTTLTVFAADDKGVLPSGIAYSNIESDVDTYVDEHKGTTAAVSVAVFTGRDVIMEKAYGYTDIEKSIKNDKDTVFEWGSCTKLLTWTSVMQLVEKGKIDLNKDIRTYLPEGFFKKLKYDKPITMINLMNHNAGWQETVTDLFVKDKKDVKELGKALQLIEPEQVHEPGTVVAYSNWGAALAGYIVERVSGQAFDDYVHEHIFQPLGMEHTALNATLSDNKWVANKRSAEKFYTTQNKSLGTCPYYITLYPAGMATGTISDFIKFGQSFLMEKGKKSPLFEKRETFDQMLSPTLLFADGRAARNCHGFWTDEFSVPVLWHSGGTLGSSSWFAFDPKSGTGMVILTNQRSESVYNCGLLPLVFGKYKSSASKISSENISGMYMAARTCYKGYAKPDSLASLILLKSKGNGSYSIPGNNTVTSIGKDSYLLTMGGLKQYVIHASTNKDGNTVLQLPGSDYIKVNSFGIIAEFALLVLFILAALYGLFALIISLIRLLKRKNVREAIEIYRAIVNASVFAAAMLITYMCVKLFSGLALLNNIKFIIMLIIVLALIPIAYAIILAVKWKKLNYTKKEKVKLIMTCTAGLIMTINVIFWQTYKFW